MKRSEFLASLFALGVAPMCPKPTPKRKYVKFPDKGVISNSVMHNCTFEIEHNAHAVVTNNVVYSNPKEGYGLFGTFQIKPAK